MQGRAMDSEDKNGTLSSLAVALALTWIAGFVDAVGWLTFAHVYVANMSGNSVAVGISLGRGDFEAFLKHFWPVFIYVAGLVCGRLMLEIAGRLRVRRVASIAFAFEALVLSGVALTGNRLNSYWLQVGLLAFTMGIQNATLTRFSSLTLHSGFVTGTLLKFAQELVKFGTWAWDESRKGGFKSQAIGRFWNEESFRRSWYLGMAWLSYITGAVLGAISRDRAGIQALVWPIFGLMCLMILDLRRPVAVKDEELQVQSG